MRIILCSLSVLVAFSVCVELRAQSLTVGAGAVTCGKFAQYYAEAPEIIETVYFTWAQGYVTGFARSLGAMGAKDLDLRPPGFGEKEQKHFVREYCTNRPLADYSEAAAALLQEIIKFQP